MVSLQPDKKINRSLSAGLLYFKITINKLFVNWVINWVKLLAIWALNTY